MNRITAIIVIALGSVLMIALSLQGAQFRLPGYDTGYQPVQPVAYSHRLHAGQLGMDCQYCHFAAEQGPNAGIPPVNVCMNCHTTVFPARPEIQKLVAAQESGESIEWVQVHRLPDFVRFDHRRHVAANVACQTCHGAVETMEQVRQVNSLSMGWCVSCHREYTNNPPEGYTPPAGSAGPSTDCSACHQ